DPEPPRYRRILERSDPRRVAAEVVLHAVGEGGALLRPAPWRCFHLPPVLRTLRQAEGESGERYEQNRAQEEPSPAIRSAGSHGSFLHRASLSVTPAPVPSSPPSTAASPGRPRTSACRSPTPVAPPPRCR